MSERAITKEDDFAGEKNPRLRASFQRIQKKVDEGAQVTLFGVAGKRRKRLDQLTREIRALQGEVNRMSKERFYNRPPVSVTPYSLLPWAWVVASDIGNLEKLVLATLFRFSIDKKRAYPSESTIAGYLSKSVRQVQRAIKKCVDRGYITIFVSRIHGQKWCNEYEFNITDIRKGKMR